MQADTGESTEAINKRSDDQAMNDIISALRAGGRLKLHRKINKAVVEGLPESHPAMSPRRHHLITISRARRLEREGVITQSGIDQYMLAPGFDDPEFTT